VYEDKVVDYILELAAVTTREVTPDDLAAGLTASRGGLTFIHAPTLPGVPEGLPRPTVSPAEVGERLRAHMVAGGSGA